MVTPVTTEYSSLSHVQPCRIRRDGVGDELAAWSWSGADGARSLSGILRQHGHCLRGKVLHRGAARRGALIIHASMQADLSIRIPVNESSRLGQPLTARSLVGDGTVSCGSPCGKRTVASRQDRTGMCCSDLGSRLPDSRGPRHKQTSFRVFDYLLPSHILG